MRSVSGYSDKNDFIKAQLANVLEEARQLIRANGQEPVPEVDDIDDRLANVIVSDLLFGYNQWAAKAELSGFIAYLRSPAGQELIFSTGYATIYSKLFDSIVEELVSATVNVERARAQAADNIDEMTANHLRGGRSNYVAIARNLLGDTEARPTETQSEPAPAAAASGGGCLLALIGLLAVALARGVMIYSRRRARY